MAFKEVSTLDADVTIALGGTNRKTGKKNPTSAEGYFLGSRKVESKKSKSGFAYIHFLQTSKGNLGIWGKTDIDRKLSSVLAGTMVRLSFDKMVPTPNGEMYKYKVEVDSTNTIEVDLASDNSVTDNVGGNYGDDSTEVTNDDEDSINDNESSYESAESSQAAALSALERKAKVEALLKGKGRTTRN